MSVKRGEIEEELRSRIKGEDIVRAWMGEKIQLGEIPSEKGTDIVTMERLLRKLGIEVPKDERQLRETFEAVWDIFFFDVWEKHCRKEVDVDVRQHHEGTGRYEGGDVDIYRCWMPNVGEFYIVRNSVEYPDHDYFEYDVEIVKDFGKAHRSFKHYVDMMPEY